MQNYVGSIIVPGGNRFHVGKSMLGLLYPPGKVECVDGLIALPGQVS